jgi:hypothetical protein
MRHLGHRVGDILDIGKCPRYSPRDSRSEKCHSLTHLISAEELKMGASRVWKLFVPIVALSFYSTPSWTLTGEGLLSWCMSDNKIERTSCEVYITGFVQGVLAHSYLSDKLCFPNNLTGEEATAVFVRKLREIAEASNKLNKPPPEARAFFSEQSNVALAAALGLQFKCH